MLLAIRFFEPLFGALIVVPFFGLPPWLLRFKLYFRALLQPSGYASSLQGRISSARSTGTHGSPWETGVIPARTGIMPTILNGETAGPYMRFR